MLTIYRALQHHICGVWRAAYFSQESGVLIGLSPTDEWDPTRRPPITIVLLNTHHNYGPTATHQQNDNLGFQKSSFNRDNCGIEQQSGLFNVKQA